MKTAQDPRHKARIETVKSLFAQSFSEKQELTPEAEKVIKQKSILDLKIANAAPQWPIDKLNKIDLAILRLAVYEFDLGETPPKVVIDEAVEIAKMFGGESSPSFVNGVLGTIYSNETKNE